MFDLPSPRGGRQHENEEAESVVVVDEMVSVEPPLPQPPQQTVIREPTVPDPVAVGGHRVETADSLAPGSACRVASALGTSS